MTETIVEGINSLPYIILWDLDTIGLPIGMSVDDIYQKMLHRVGNNLAQWYFLSSSALPQVEQEWQKYSSLVSFTRTPIYSQKFLTGFSKYLNFIGSEVNLYALTGHYDFYSYLLFNDQILIQKQKCAIITWVFPEHMPTLSIFFESFRMFPLSLFIRDFILPLNSDAPCPTGFVHVLETAVLPQLISNELLEQGKNDNSMQVEAASQALVTSGVSSAVSSVVQSPVNDAILEKSDPSDETMLDPVQNERLERLQLYVTELFLKFFRENGIRIMTLSYLTEKFVLTEDDLGFLCENKVLKRVTFAFDKEVYYKLIDTLVYDKVSDHNVKYRTLYEVFNEFGKNKPMMLMQDLKSYLGGKVEDESVDHILSNAEKDHVVKLVCMLIDPWYVNGRKSISSASVSESTEDFKNDVYKKSQDEEVSTFYRSAAPRASLKERHEDLNKKNDRRSSDSFEKRPSVDIQRPHERVSERYKGDFNDRNSERGYYGKAKDPRRHEPEDSNSQCRSILINACEHRKKHEKISAQLLLSNLSRYSDEIKSDLNFRSAEEFLSYAELQRWISHNTYDGSISILI